MTLVDIKNALLSHFLTCPTFNLGDDMDVIKIDRKEAGNDFVAHKEEIVRYSLNELAKVGVVAQVSENLYILTQSLNSMSQTIVLTPVTALMLADLVNGFTRQTGEQKETGYVVNKMAVTDYDISTLCRICHTMLNMDEEDDEDIIPPPEPKRK